MKFTSYIWDLYKTSDIGRVRVELFERKNIYKLSKEFDFELEYEYIDAQNKVQVFKSYNALYDETGNYTVNDIDDARKMYAEVLDGYLGPEKTDFSWFITFLSPFSTALYHRFPEFFLPFYFMQVNHADFLRLCDNFGIVLPPNPHRFDYIKRTWYYFDVCEILQQFRRKHGISVEEFPAFLYFFGLECLENIDEEGLPKPSGVFFFGAGGGAEDCWDFNFLDKADINSSNTWGAGSLRVKKGDLVLMYCLSPRKYIHSIWRALDDSFVNPFSYYYYTVRVGFPRKIKFVKLHELKDSKFLKNNPVVKGNMRGLNGRIVSAQEYAELLDIINEKGQSTDEFPKLPIYNKRVGFIENERDVEINLIEPLLKEIGINEHDWVRQLPLRMGRGIRYYPDYAIFVRKTKGQEKAKIVLEAKYSISSGKQLEEAFFQARSYGLRLQAEKIVIADRDFLWLYDKKNDDFKLNDYLRIHWNDLTNADVLHRLKAKLRK